MQAQKILMIMIVRAGWFGEGTCETIGVPGSFSVTTYDAREDPPESLTKIGNGAVVVDGRCVDLSTAIDGAYKLPILDVMLEPGMMRKLLGEAEKADGPYSSLDYVALDIWTELHRVKGYRIGKVSDGVVIWE
jgi:hypothetical protein